MKYIHEFINIQDVDTSKEYPSPGLALVNETEQVVYADYGDEEPYRFILEGNIVRTKATNLATLTLIAGEGGGVSGGGNYRKGSQVTFRAIPAMGYVFTNWNDGNTNEIRTITLSEDTTFTAYFRPATVSEYLRSKGYQTCEYIESSGTQYIDTGVKADEHTGISIRHMYLQQGVTIIGAREEYNSKHFQITNYSYLSGVNGYFASYASGQRWISLNITALNTIYTVIYDSNSKTVSCPETGISTTNSKGYISYQTPQTLTLFALQTAGVTVENGKMRLYYCILDNLGIPVRRYYPVYSIAMGTVGLYDLVSDSFFGNNGTGAFLKGSDYEFTDPV